MAARHLKNDSFPEPSWSDGATTKRYYLKEMYYDVNKLSIESSKFSANLSRQNVIFNSQRHSSFKVQDPKDFNERVKNSKVPVIVDFFATWCNPCRTLGPRLESVIAEKNGKILLAKVDIDENTDIALDYDLANALVVLRPTAEYGEIEVRISVGSVPALIAIKDGKIQERLVGLQDTDKLRKFVDKVVASAATGPSK
uniref:(California timema) hypothetical protein n=1 Tax=Timema californicum TaxID=61474 RepID=A0A7R9P554_TIMCA|nr:unnamed protein product [Timema californicum]